MADVTSQGVLGAIARKNVASSGGIAYVDSAETYNSFSSGPTVNYPTVSENDIMLAWAVSNDNHNTTGTPPTGWTKILEVDGTYQSVSVFWKRAGASEPSSEAWTSIFDAIEQSAWEVLAYSGCVNSGSPIDNSFSESSGFDAAKDIASTSVNNNSMGVACFATSAGTAFPFTFDGGIMERVDANLGSALNVAIGDSVVETAGAYSLGGDYSSATFAVEAVVGLIPQ